MRLIVQPGDGLEPFLSAIKKAKKSVDVTIFRLDRQEIEAALKTAVRNGAEVRALIAGANRGGRENLRRLEMRLLESGVIVARTAGDLIRYHDKMLIIDRRELYVLSFNYTRLDINHSRGFGIATRNAKFVQEARKLFEADCARKPYAPGLDALVVSPGNSRKVLGALLKRARKQLLIYDPKISDKEMIRILRDRAQAGVEIKIIGRLGKNPGLPVQKLNKMLLHTRTIICDRRRAFIGSQSLRALELDSRREVGMIIQDPPVVERLIATFEADWASRRREKAPEAAKQEETMPAPEQEAARAVQAVVKELDPLTETVKNAVKKAVARAGEEVLEDEKVKDEVKATVKKAVKKAVKQAVQEVTQEAKEAHARI